MKNYLRKIIKEERASATLLVFVTVLTFVTVLLGAYLTVTTLKQSQLKSDIRLQQIYGKDVERVDEIYEELMAKDIQGPSCEIKSIITGSNTISYQFTFNEPVKDFLIDDIKLYKANSISSDIGNGGILSTSNPAYATTLSANKKYIVSFDYQCISDSQEFEIGLYSDTLDNLPTKKLIASDAIKHESYIIEPNTSSVQFKMLSQIQDSNNITISNFVILELENVQTSKENFIKNNDTTYVLVSEYNEGANYVIILENGICTDLEGNKNKEIIKII